MGARLPAEKGISVCLTLSPATTNTAAAHRRRRSGAADTTTTAAATAAITAFAAFAFAATAAAIAALVFSEPTPCAVRSLQPCERNIMRWIRVG